MLHAGVQTAQICPLPFCFLDPDTQGPTRIGGTIVQSPRDLYKELWPVEAALLYFGDVRVTQLPENAPLPDDDTNEFFDWIWENDECSFIMETEDLFDEFFLFMQTEEGAELHDQVVGKGPISYEGDGKWEHLFCEDWIPQHWKKKYKRPAYAQERWYYHNLPPRGYGKRWSHQALAMFMGYRKTYWVWRNSADWKFGLNCYKVEPELKDSEEEREEEEEEGEDSEEEEGNHIRNSYEVPPDRPELTRIELNPYTRPPFPNFVKTLTPVQVKILHAYFVHGNINRSMFTRTVEDDIRVYFDADVFTPTVQDDIPVFDDDV